VEAKGTSNLVTISESGRKDSSGFLWTCGKVCFSEDLEMGLRGNSNNDFLATWEEGRENQHLR